jgi:Fe-S cluster assembly ATPase SufC
MTTVRRTEQLDDATIARMERDHPVTDYALVDGELVEVPIGFAKSRRQRIMIAGPSGTGKSTLARAMAAEMGLALIPTDDFMHMEWSAVSQYVADLIADGAPRIVEGVRVPHVLRKALAQRPGVKPCDRLIVLAAAMREQTPRQVSMGKACATVLAEVLPMLQALGVVVEQR